MIVMVYALLVWYDAANVRYESGKHAQYINTLRQEMHRVMTTDEHHYFHPNPLELLKERLGHTPVEITVGVLFGLFVTLGVVALIDSYIISFSFVV